MTQCSHINRIAIRRAHQNLANPHGIFETHIFPGLTRISGFINAIPIGMRGSNNKGLARTRPNLFGIGLGNGHGANGGIVHIVKDRLPTNTGIGCFKDPARCGSHIRDIGIPRFSHYCASAISIRTHKAETKVTKRIFAQINGLIFLSGGGATNAKNAKRGQSVFSHCTCLGEERQVTNKKLSAIPVIETSSTDLNNTDLNNIDLNNIDLQSLIYYQRYRSLYFLGRQSVVLLLFRRIAIGVISA